MMMNEQPMMEENVEQQGITVQEVAQLLMQGETVESLVKQGIPQDMIFQAIEFIKQQSVATNEAPTQGLAGM